MQKPMLVLCPHLRILEYGHAGARPVKTKIFTKIETQSGCLEPKIDGSGA